MSATTRFDYWQEAVETALEESGVKVTPEQLAEIVESIKTSRECESMAYAPVENPLTAEVRELKIALKDEREKVVCDTCNGRGRLISYGGTMQANTQCWKCRGEGYRKP